MSPIVVSVVVGVMTTLGRWARGKGLTIDTVVGVVVLAIVLSVIDTANEKLGKAFGVLIVVGVAFAHVPVILDATGLGKGKANE
jgi:hypothetical protein